MYTRDPIQLSHSAMVTLLESLGVLRFYSYMFAAEIHNCSHHIQYEDTKPVALGKRTMWVNYLGRPDLLTLATQALLFRVPRNSQAINIALRVRLADLTCTCFLAAASQSVAEFLHSRCIKEAKLLATHPLYILAFVLEERHFSYKQWEISLSRDLNDVETVTGMTPPLWRKKEVLATKAEWLRDYDNQLKHLHATNTELQHCKIVHIYAAKLGNFCLLSGQMVDDLRSQLGLDPIPEHHRVAYEEYVKFFLGRIEFTHIKLQEIIERLKTQINVVWSHSSLTRWCSGGVNTT